MNYTDNSYFVNFNDDSVAAKKVKKEEVNATGTAVPAAGSVATKL
jgi:hypothetical protein